MQLQNVVTGRIELVHDNPIKPIQSQVKNAKETTEKDYLAPNKIFGIRYTVLRSGHHYLLTVSKTE